MSGAGANGAREISASLGRAARSLTTAATLDDRLSAGGLRVALVVLELTLAHGKRADRVSRSVIAERANVTERTVTRTLTRLQELGVIRWEPARARGQLGRLELCERETPECLAFGPVDNGRTRDIWVSRVGCERETQSDRTRDTERSNVRHPDVPLPGSTVDLPSSRPRDAIAQRIVDAFPGVRFEDAAKKLHQIANRDNVDYRTVLDERVGRMIEVSKDTRIRDPLAYLDKMSSTSRRPGARAS